MRIDEIPINRKVISLLESIGFSKLFPPQEDALKTDVLNGKNLGRRLNPHSLENQEEKVNRPLKG